MNINPSKNSSSYTIWFNVYGRGPQIAYQCRKHLQIPGARRQMWTNLHTEDPQSSSDLCIPLSSDASCSVHVNWYTFSYWRKRVLGTIVHNFRVRDSSVGIAIRYGLDGLGIESRWGGKIFLTLLERPWGPSSLLYNGYRVFPGGKAAGGVAMTTHPNLAPRLKEEMIYTSTPPLRLRGLLGIQDLCTPDLRALCLIHWLQFYHMTLKVNSKLLS